MKHIIIFTIFTLFAYSCASNPEKKNESSENNDKIISEIEDEFDQSADINESEDETLEEELEEAFDQEDIPEEKVVTNEKENNDDLENELKNNEPILKKTIPKIKISAPKNSNNNYSKYFNINKNSLIYAAKRGSVETLKYFLKIGLNINHQNINGQTALMIATKYGRIENIIFLLNNNANITIKDKKGKKAKDFITRRNKKILKQIFKNHEKKE